MPKKMLDSPVKFIHALALLFLTFVFIFDFMFFFKTIDDKNRDVVIGIVNILNSGGLIMILSFFFGSSKNSKDKDDTIAMLRDQAKDNTITTISPDNTTTTVTTTDGASDVACADCPNKKCKDCKVDIITD